VLCVSLAVAAASLLGATGLTAQVTVELDTIRAGRFDYGKMWTFEYAPEEYFSETYGFEADAAWFERARLSALRIPGCSSSFVSPNGLMVTNHHCVRGVIGRVARPGETLLDSGFVAWTLEDERRIPGYYTDQLVAALDVTDEVFAAIDRATDDSGRAAAREEVYAAIEERLQGEYAELGEQLRVQLVPLYNGGRHSAYVFRRFTDVRLVAAAELQMGFFGGDPDNFTYPRYALDFAFLRVYQDDRPYRTDHYFGWGSEGVEENDVVFVIGNPGPTNRLATVAQLEYQRDELLPPIVAFLSSRLETLNAFRAAAPAQAEAMDLRNRAFGLSNSLKASAGRLAALEDPAIMARKADAERQLQEAIAADPALGQRFGGLFAEIAALQPDKRAFADEYAAFYRMGAPVYTSALLRRAVAAVAWLEAREAGTAPERVAELRRELELVPDAPRQLERDLLALRLADFQRYLGPQDPLVQRALGSRGPEEAAEHLLGQSELRSQSQVQNAVAAGRLTMDDPIVQMGAAVARRYEAMQQGLRAILARESELEAELGRARFAVYGQSVPPDASSSPRITDGVVLPYEYNGTLAPVYTTFYGMYDRYYAFGPGTDWELPYRWRIPPVGLDLGTPLNFISTSDTYGGNSGSPAVTKDLAIVGLNFDRNIQGLSRDFIYLPERGRNIMVDVRAIEAALEYGYDFDRILAELKTGRVYRTEQEAEAARN
jgi:hypothetical protein